MMDSYLLSLLTRPVIRRKLVCDKSIQECIDSVRNRSVRGLKATLMMQNANTHRIRPLRAYLSLDPVNETHSTTGCTHPWLYHTSPFQALNCGDTIEERLRARAPCSSSVQGKESTRTPGYQIRSAIEVLKQLPDQAHQRTRRNA